MGFLKAPKLAQLSRPQGCLANYLMHKPISPYGAQLVAYPVIVCQARRRGISGAEIAAHIGISTEELHRKLCGKTTLFSHEACAIQMEFFPDVDLETLTWRAGGELWYAEDDEP